MRPATGLAAYGCCSRSLLGEIVRQLIMCIMPVVYTTILLPRSPAEDGGDAIVFLVNVLFEPPNIARQNVFAAIIVTCYQFVEPPR